MVLQRLILLSECRDGNLGYFIPPELQATEQHRQWYPEGATDCGLAHGISGPLALLSITRLQDRNQSNIEATIRQLASWITTQRRDDAWGITWPHAVPPSGVPPADRSSSRASWCYGTPGVARSLWLAGRALDDEEMRDMAIRAIRAVRARPTHIRGIPSPILCHGIAGLLQIVLRFANDTGEDFFAEMACELTEQLVALYDSKTTLGFQDLELNGQKVDNPGLLEGATGVALALLAASISVEPAWDRMFLLS